MAAIFISYRRQDSAGYVGALRRDLRSRLGQAEVFLDITDVEGGTEFPAVLKEAILASNAIIVAIGPKWLDAVNTDGVRRLDDPNDFVRQEVALAIEHNISLIPILVDGANMPTADQLPPDIVQLANRNAIELSNSHWDEDVGRILDHVRARIYESDTRLPPDFTPTVPLAGNGKKMVYVGLGLGLLLSVLALMTAVARSLIDSGRTAAEGEVIENIERTVKGSTGFVPKVIFVTASGQRAFVTGEIISDPARYAIGEKVSVLYDETDPESAIIDSFSERWSFSAGLAAFGFVWLAIGVPPVFLRAMRRLQVRRLIRRGGRPIVTTFCRVEEDRSVDFNGHHPYRLVTEWRNPVSKEMLRFRSLRLWSDPTANARHRLITVLLDPNNFHNYLVDVASLVSSTDRPTIRNM